MVVAVGLWNLAVRPGDEPEVILPPSDLRITNVALGDQLEDQSGRTTIKLSFKSLIVPERDSEGEDEEPEPPMSTTILASLTPGKIEQSTIDIILEEGQDYLFEVIGKNTVYLTGNYIDQSPSNMPFGDESDSEESEDAYDLREVSSDVAVDPDELASDASRFEEVEDELSKPQKRPRESDPVDTNAPKEQKAKKANKKMKNEDGKAVPLTTNQDTTEKKSKKDKKKEKKEKANGIATEGDKAKKTEAGATKELPGGLKIKDVKVGSGPMAKAGQKISMRYIGKLQNGKIFDKNTKGAPFTFRLGAGEVIKGWDQGIVGMQAGGERLLTIPPALAYGNKKQSDIPPNSTLIFECKLLEIK